MVVMEFRLHEFLQRNEDKENKGSMGEDSHFIIIY